MWRKLVSHELSSFSLCLPVNLQRGRPRNCRDTSARFRVLEVSIVSEDGVSSNAQDKSWILVGGPDQNRLVKQAVNAGLNGFSDLKNDGFVLKTFHLGKRPVVVAGGDNDTGTMYAIFELAEQLGVTFRLSRGHPSRAAVLAIGACAQFARGAGHPTAWVSVGGAPGERRHAFYRRLVEVVRSDGQDEV